MADSDSNSPQDLLAFDEDEHTWLPLAEEADAGSKRRRSNGTDDILPEPSMRILMTKLMDEQHIVDKRLTNIESAVTRMESVLADLRKTVTPFHCPVCQTKLQNLKVFTAHVKKLLETTCHTPRCLLQRSERHLKMLKAQPDADDATFQRQKTEFCEALIRYAQGAIGLGHQYDVAGDADWVGV